VTDAQLSQRHKQELDEAADATGQPLRQAAPVRRNDASEPAVDGRKGRGRQRRADHDPGPECEYSGRRCDRLDGQTGRIDNAASGNDAGGAEAVSYPASDRLQDTPDQRLQSNRKGERFAAPAAVAQHRQHEQALDVTRAESDPEHGAGAEQQDPGDLRLRRCFGETHPSSAGLVRHSKTERLKLRSIALRICLRMICFASLSHRERDRG